MQYLEPLRYGKYFHIYNRGINSCDLFRKRTNYEYFLELYDKHISPVADTFAWVLMKNHFHILVRIKDKEINPLNPQGFENLEGLEDSDSKQLSQPFANLFNAYAKAYNKLYNRTGSLFEHPFRRKEIAGKEYFKTMVIYIHNNPVHHMFTKYAMDYPWSSYTTCISIKPTRLKRDMVFGWFDNEANFKNAHKNLDYLAFEEWLGME